MANFGFKDVALGASTGGLYNAGKFLMGGYDSKSGGGGLDINGELSKISGLFAALREQQEKSINKQAGQGRRAAASNLAARGVLTSGVSEHSFNALEGERLDAIANSNAQLAGQEAQIRSGLLRALMGQEYDERMRNKQAGAARTGQVVGIGTNLLLAALMRNPGALAGSRAGSMTMLPASTNFGAVV